MIDINTSAILLGFIIGIPMSILFFWGLNWGMRMALASSQPGRLLMLSFFCRLIALLVVGFGLTKLTNTLWLLAGYMLAFFLMRILVVMRAKINPDSVLSKQESV